MKATKLLIASAAFASLAALSFAGPGPEYWARMNAAAKKAKPASYPSIWQNKSAETKAKPAAKPAAETATTCAPCGCCAKKV
jgi:hypothetical protein